MKVATKNWYKSWYKVWYKSWYKYRGVWRYPEILLELPMEVLLVLQLQTTTEYTTKTITTTDTISRCTGKLHCKPAKMISTELPDYVRYPEQPTFWWNRCNHQLCKKVDETLYSSARKYPFLLHSA